MPRYDDEYDDDPRPRKRKAEARSQLPVIVACVCAVSSVLFCAFMGLLVKTNGFAPRTVNGPAVAAAEPAPPLLVPLNVPALPQLPAVNVPNVPNLPNPAAVLPPPALPDGWSYNTPACGFRAAWPYPPGADGYTPLEVAFGNVSVLSNGWATNRDGVNYSLTYSDMPAITAEEGTFIDAYHQRIYDNAARRATARGQTVPPHRPWAPIRWLGHNARQIIAPGDGRSEQTEGRTIIFGTKVYTLEIGGPKAMWPDDPRIKTFFDTFTGL